MSELGAEAQSLIERERSGDEPSSADRERLRGKLIAELGAAAFAGTAIATAATASSTTASVPATTSATTTGGMFGALKLGLAALVVGALGVGAVLGLRTEPRAARPSTVTPSVMTAPQPAPVVAPLEAPAPVVPATTAEPPPSPAPRVKATRSRAQPIERAAPEAPAPVASDPGTLAAELALLSRAQTALRTNQPAEALHLVREHEQRFAHGSLAQERLGIAALARCALGEDGAAVVRELASTAPGSPMLERVREACGKK